MEASGWRDGDLQQGVVRGGDWKVLVSLGAGAQALILAYWVGWEEGGRNQL